MSMEDEADALLARIRMIRDDLQAGRLSSGQARLYAQLGREVERITRCMDLAVDVEIAEVLWKQGATLIRSFLDEHFPLPTRH